MLGFYVRLAKCLINKIGRIHGSVYEHIPIYLLLSDISLFIYISSIELPSWRLRAIKTKGDEPSMYLSKVDFTQRSVTTISLMGPGGVSSPGVYTRTRKNLLSSPKLLRRIAGVAAAMADACSLGDHCTNNTKLIGKMAPDGKPYKTCTREEADGRKRAAVECARRVLPTKY
jgi:hypothetical protein